MSIQTIQILQIIFSVLLILSILLQNRGSGVGGVFGGNDSVFRVKRGVEKILFRATIVLTIIFFGLAVWGLYLYKIS